MAAMPYDSLADFLEELSGQDRLARVAAEVDGELELAEITRRVADEGGPALLFEHLKNQSMAVVSNLLGSEQRVCQALGLERLEEICDRLESLVASNTPRNWFDRLRTSADEAGANKFRPRIVKSGPSQQVVRLGRDIDLAALPLVKSWPDESFASLTSGVLITQHRTTGTRAATLCPLQAATRDGLAVVADGHTQFTQHLADWAADGEKLPVAVIAGGDPALLAAAALELPGEMDFFHLVGLLRGKPLELVKCRTHPLEVPAEADMIFEGYVDSQAAGVTITAAAAGGTHYRTIEQTPLVQLTAVTHRSHPIVPAIIDTGSRGEWAALGKARERMVLAGLKAAEADIVDLHLPLAGGPHRWAVVSLRKRFPFQARQVASALWGSAALRFTKFLVVVDGHVDVRDARQVLAAVGSNVAPDRDMISYDGPAHASDHANALAPLGRHVAFDATAKIAGERSGQWPAELRTSEATREQVTARWAEYQLELLQAVKQ